MRQITIILIILSCYIVPSQDIRKEDKTRIAEAIKISSFYGESLWKGFNKVPFIVLLVTDDYEYLINHPNPTNDFKLSQFDSVLESNIYYRKTTFNKHFLATFPAINGMNCIVVGTPENTNKNSSEWIITLIHEHFHQYVYASNNYFKDVQDLNLSNGDNTGMWMLNYPFKYDNKNIIKFYKHYTKSLQDLAKLYDSTTSHYKIKLEAYKTSRKKFTQSLSKDDYKYFSFQLWQEGIARYTEIKFLELISSYKVSKEVEQLNDFVDFDILKKDFLAKELNNLTELNLEKEKRVCFYSVGLAEGLILDKTNINWRDLYLKEKFYLEKY